MEELPTTATTQSMKAVMAANEQMIYSQSKLIQDLFYKLEDKRWEADKLNKQISQIETQLKTKHPHLMEKLQVVLGLRQREDQLNEELVRTDISKIQSSTKIEQVRKEMRTYKKKKSTRTSFHETDALSKTKIFRMIEQQMLKISLMMSSTEQVEEIHREMWRKGINDFKSRAYQSTSDFIQQFSSFIKKSFVPHEFRKQVWPLLMDDYSFIRKEYFNQLVDRLHCVPQKVIKAITRDLDRTLTSESNITDAIQLKQDALQLLSMFHLHRPDISYVQGMTYPLIILLANLDKFQAFRCFCSIMTSDFVVKLFCFDIAIVIKYCKVFEHFLASYDRKLYDHLQSLNLSSQAFLVEWYYTFFSRRFKYENLCKLWDLLLVYSYRVFFKLPLAIMMKLKPILLQTSEYSQCLEIIRTFNQHTDELQLLLSLSDINLRSQQIAEVIQKVKVDV